VIFSFIPPPVDKIGPSSVFDWNNRKVEEASWNTLIFIETKQQNMRKSSDVNNITWNWSKRKRDNVKIPHQLL
jgi:hypothetical protein